MWTDVWLKVHLGSLCRARTLTRQPLEITASWTSRPLCFGFRGTLLCSEVILARQVDRQTHTHKETHSKILTKKWATVTLTGLQKSEQMGKSASKHEHLSKTLSIRLLWESSQLDATACLEHTTQRVKVSESTRNMFVTKSLGRTPSTVWPFLAKKISSTTTQNILLNAKNAVSLLMPVLSVVAIRWQYLARVQALSRWAFTWWSRAASLCLNKPSCRVCPSPSLWRPGEQLSAEGSIFSWP